VAAKKGLARAKPRSRRSARTGELRVLVLSGPNLGRLGKREPSIYGSTTLADLHGELAVRAKRRGADVDCRQSNHEGELIDWIESAEDHGFSGLLLNPGALTHTSYALYDALKGSSLPTVEVHISNPDARETFRKSSLVAPACVARVAGFGVGSYFLALDGLLDRLASA
jgi:3-dehydroquinate dehydratase-2